METEFSGRITFRLCLETFFSVKEKIFRRSKKVFFFLISQAINYNPFLYGKLFILSENNFDQKVHKTFSA